MCTGDTTWEDIEYLMKRFLDGDRFGNEKVGSYGLSKAALAVLTMQMAAKYPNIKVKYKSDFKFKSFIYVLSYSLHVCPRATFRLT